MNSGYLYIESLTQPEHAYHLAMSVDKPDSERVQEGRKLVYIAKFRDIDAAFMHASGKLRHRCKHLDTVTFLTELTTMIAVIEADGLKHERIWLADVLDAKEMDALRTETERLQKQAGNQDLIWKMVGIVAVVIFLLLSIAI
ncbi:MAG: hypothetical protein OEX12_04660 [Gammaproteobacteria bacterium]|nr:hypothetical protein [Gammaproteobacteria bacterium]